MSTKSSILDRYIQSKSNDYKKTESSSILSRYIAKKENELYANSGNAAKEVTSRINTWLENSGNFINNYNRRTSQAKIDTYDSSSQAWFDTITAQKNNFDLEADNIRSILNTYGKYFNEEWVSEINKALDERGKTHNDIIKGAEGQNNYWKQFSSAEEYEKLYDNYTYGTKYEGKTYADIQKAIESTVGREKEWLTGNADLFMNSVEAQTTIDNINQELKDVKRAISQLSGGTSRRAPMTDKEFEVFTGLIARRDELAARKQTLLDVRNTAKKEERKTEFYNAFLPAELFPEIDMPDFDSYVKQGENEGTDISIFRQYSDYAISIEVGDTESSKAVKYARHMTENEYNNYLYCLGKYGNEVANRYLDIIEDDVNAREGKEMANSVGNNFLSQAFFAAFAGIDQFAAGIDSLFSSDDYIPTSSVQYASGIVRENLKDNGIPYFNLKTGKWEDWDVNIFGSSAAQVMYDAINTTSNMLPSILVSAGANAIVPGSGAYVGATLLGSSAAGNAKAELLNLGYSQGQANLYGLMVGVSEAGLQYLLGGVTSLGGSSTGLTKFALSKVDNAFARVAITLGGNMLSEGFEEGLQTVIEPWLKEIATGVDWESPDIDEILYSSLLGALSAFGLEGGQTVVGEVRHSNALKNTGKSILNTPNGYDALKALAEQMHSDGATESDALIDRLAAKTQKGVDAIKNGTAKKRQVNATARDVGRLSESVNSARNQQNLAEIQSVLESKGVDSSKAKTAAELLNRLLYDNELTKAEHKTLMSDERVYDTYRDLISSSDSTLKSRNLKHTLGRMGITTNADGTHTIASLSDNRSVTMPNSESNTKDTAQKSNYTVSDDGVTRMTETGESVEIADVVSVDEKGDVYVKLKNGQTVNTRDISFSNDNEAALYEQIGVYINDKDASVGLHPSAAKEIIGLYDSSFGVSPEEFLNAAAIAYKYGKYNLPKREISNRLPNEVSDRIYKLGQVFTENKVKQSEERIKAAQYRDADVNEELLELTNRIADGESVKANEKVYFGTVSSAVAARIQELTGVDVHGFKIAIEARQIEHILKRHGKNGVQDNSLENISDIAKIEHVIKKPDSIKSAGKTQAYSYMENGRNKTADTVICEKDIGGKSYYVVEAVPDTKAKTLYVVTAFIGKTNIKKEASQFINAKGPDVNVQNEAASASNNMVSQNEPSVNSKDMQDSAKNTRKEGKLLSETTGESFEIDEASLNDDQKAGLYTAKILSKALGINVYVYESYLNGEGKRVYLNADGKEVPARKGFYDAATGAIHIDLNAGKDTLNGKTVVLYTLSHELVHFVRQWSPSKFKMLADFLVSKYGEQGISVDALIHNQIKNAKEDGRTITYDTAYEEVIADSMQTMLSSGNVVESLVELKKTDRTLWEKIKSFIFDMLDRLKKALGIYKNLSPDTIEGNLVAKMKDSISELERLFTEGLADASENFKKTDVSKFEASEGVKYSVAGKYSETADFSALSVAMKMLAKDPRADTVSKTGWWKGKDGRWRYEISDKYMDLKYGAEHSARRISDYVKHDRLFEAYPQLEYVKLEFADKKVMNDYGSYNANINTIKIRNDLKGKDLRQTLIHEMQHAVQYIERFASGTNVDEAAAWIFVYTYDIIKSNPEFKKLQTKEARQLYIVKEAEKLFNRKFKSIAYQLYENEHGEKEATQVEQRMEYDDTYLKHNPVSNDGIIFDSTDQLQKEFVDTMVKIGYTQSEAIKITEGDVLHELIFHQRRDADKRSNAIPYRRNARYGSNRSTVHADGSSGEGRIGENGNVSGKSDMGAAYSESNRESSEIRYLQSEEFSLEKGIFRESKEVGSGTTETFPPVGHSILKYSSASTDLSPRNLLSNALESEAKTDAEREKLTKYKAKISEIEALEGKLEEINRQIREISFGKGPRDMEKFRSLQDEKIKTMNRIDIADKQLLRLETAKALQDIVERQIKLKLNDMKADMKEQYKQADERREKTLRRNQIRKTVDDLNRLLTRPTKEKHVPIWLQKPVAEFLNALEKTADPKLRYYDSKIEKLENELEALKHDPDATEEMLIKKETELNNAKGRWLKTSEHLSEILEAYKRIEETKDPEIAVVYRSEIAEKLEKIIKDIGRDVSLSEMTLSNLNKVFTAVRLVERVISVGNKMFSAKSKKVVTEYARDIASEITSNSEESKSKLAELRKELTNNKLVINNLKPLTLAKMIGSDTLTVLIDRMIDSESTWAIDRDEAKKFYEEVAKENKIRKSDFDKELSVTLSGEEITLTRGEIAALYALSKRKKAVEHLTTGGFYLRSEDNQRAKAYKISKEELSNIGNLLENEQRQFADKMRKYLSGTMASKGNETSRIMYGTDLFADPEYFPMEVEKTTLPDDKQVAETVAKRTKNLGMTKQTKPGAGNALVISDFFTAWDKHVNDMALYHAVTTVEDFSRVWNSKLKDENGGVVALKKIIEEKCGEEIVAYFEKLINDANVGVRMKDYNTTAFFDTLVSRSKKAAVLGSLSVAVQQISAVERAKAYIPGHFFTTSLFSQLKNGHKATWEEMKKYCPVAIIKEMGGYDLTGRNTMEWTFGSKGVIAKLDNALGRLPALMDEVAWCAIWKAGKKMTASLRSKNGEILYEKGSEAFYEKASEIVTEAIRHTQVYDSIFVRSGHMRNDDWLSKTATTFMAEPTTSFNMYVEAAIDLKRGGEIRTAGGYFNARRFALRKIRGVVSASIGAALVAAIVHAMRDDDEEKTLIEKYAGHAIRNVRDNINPLNMLPFGRDIVSIVNGYDVERADMTLISDLIYTFNGLDSDKPTSEKISELAGSISDIFGVPYKNIRRDTIGILNSLFNSVPLSETTWLGMKEAVSEEISDKEVSNSDLLYEAMLGGNKKEIGRIKSRYDSESEIRSAIRKGLRENDPRIREAAVLNVNGDMKDYAEIVNEIASEKIFEKDRIIEAVNLEINAINRKSNVTDNEPIDEDETVTSLFNASMLNRTLDSGDTETALEMINDMVNAKVESGKTEKEAKSAIKSNVTRYWKEKYIAAWRAGDDEEMVRIRKLLTETNLYGGAYKVSTTVSGWLKDAVSK